MLSPKYEKEYETPAAIESDLQKGCFISFEGGEGVGKSTQISLLAEILKHKGFEVVITHEPGGTSGAEIMRYILLQNKLCHSFPITELILFSAARDDHLKKVVIPALLSGKIVLCDRFIDSTRVYQGMIGGIDKNYIMLLETILVGSMMPDLTFILDLPAEIAMMRVKKRSKNFESTDPFEQDGLNIQENRRQAFLEIAKEEPNRCHIIAGHRNIEAIAYEIAKITDRLIKNRQKRILKLANGN